jgi:hypothetical protein
MDRRSSVILCAATVALTPISAMSTKPAPVDQITLQHKFFVAKYARSFSSEAIALEWAKFPPGTQSRGEFRTKDGAKLLAYKLPGGTTDTIGLDVLILQNDPNGTVHLWHTSTDLSRSSKAEADSDLENFREVARGPYRLFERSEA